jgi:hypothetical protein
MSNTGIWDRKRIGGLKRALHIFPDVPPVHCVLPADGSAVLKQVGARINDRITAQNSDQSEIQILNPCLRHPEYKA